MRPNMCAYNFLEKDLNRFCLINKKHYPAKTMFINFEGALKMSILNVYDYFPLDHESNKEGLILKVL